MAKSTHELASTLARMAAGRYFTTVLPVAARWPAPEREALAAVRYGGVILSMIVQELTMECLSGARAGIWGGQPVAGRVDQGLLVVNGRLGGRGC